MTDRAFWEAAGIRALRTFIQVILAVWTAGQVHGLCNNQILSQIRGKHCVLSMYVKVASGTTVSIMWQYEVYAVGSTSRLKYGNTAKTVTGTGEWSRLTFELDVEDSIFTQGTGTPDYSNCEIRMSVWRNPSENYMSAFQLKNLKLEVGNKATDWTPAPEDAEEYAKTATNYITVIDSNGIRVHADNNPTSNYAKIDANGMEVYKGGDSVALYGDTSRIGKEDARHISISSGAFNVVDSDGTVQMSVNTGGGSKTYSPRVYGTIAAGSTETKVITELGAITELKVNAGTSDYLTPSTSLALTVNATTTINNVTFTVTAIPDTKSFTLTISNASTATRYASWGYSYTINEAIVDINGTRFNYSTGQPKITSIGTGSLDLGIYNKYGQVCQLWLQIQTSGSRSSGAEVFSGTMMENLPIQDVTISGYYTNHALVGIIDQNGNITVTNCGSSSVSITGNNYAVLTATYILKRGY